ncbi:MAG TPA: hypothetical protein VIX35_05540 [Vicinamibacterales bacterium]
MLLPTVFAVACSQSNTTAPSAPANATTGSALFLTTAAKGSKSASTPVMTTLAPGYALSGDGAGSYTNGTAGVISILTQSGYNGLTGDWMLDTTGSTSRTVSESLVGDVNDPSGVAPTPPAGFSSPELVGARVEVLCTYNNHTMVGIPPGTSVTCPLVNRFYFKNVEYNLNQAPKFSGTSETMDVQVTCTSATSPCSAWSIMPSGSAVARLQKVNEPHAPTNLGDFFDAFSIQVAIQ